MGFNEKISDCIDEIGTQIWKLLMLCNVWCNHKYVTKFLLQEGGTPLMYAAYNGYPQVVKLLLGKKTFSTLLLSWVLQNQNQV